MTEITSPHNEALKEIRKLAGRRWRDKLGEFVAEGEDLLEAADAAGWHATARYAATGSGPGRASRSRRTCWPTVSQLGSGTRAIGVYPQRWSAAVGPRCVALWGVGDPGNVGTVHPLRAGVRRVARVALGPGSADPYGHKAVRASMGALFSRARRARARRSRAARPARRARRARGRAAARAAVDGDVTLVVGAEREGLPADVVAACDDVAHIPIAHADSLNAAMAATVALYELD